MKAFNQAQSQLFQIFSRFFSVSLFPSVRVAENFFPGRIFDDADANRNDR